MSRGGSPENFIQNVQHLLKLRGWTYRELESRTGIKFTAIGKYLRGETVPGLKVLDVFAKAFEVSPSELLINISDKNVVAGKHSIMDCARTMRELLSDLGDANETPLVQRFLAEIEDKKSGKKKKK